MARRLFAEGLERESRNACIDPGVILSGAQREGGRSAVEGPGAIEAEITHKTGAHKLRRMKASAAYIARALDCASLRSGDL